jgi:hypothetical protein
VLGIKIMEPDKMGKADITALVPVFHEMLEKVAHLDQFGREIAGTDHLEGE